MIRQIFLLVISLGVGLWAQPCPSHYAPESFEESSDELIQIIEEYFEAKKISFPPKTEEVLSRGLAKKMPGLYQLPNSTVSYGQLQFPVIEGIWKYRLEDNSITITHLLIPEHTRLTQQQALYRCNGLIGEYWNDYEEDGYSMQLMPEEVRVRYRDRYFGLSVTLYGIRTDATGLGKTTIDLRFADYTTLVQRYRACKEKP